MRSAGLEVAVVFLLAVAMRLNTRGRTDRAGALSMAVLMLGLCALALNGQGLFDEALMAFPALLLFAGLFGFRRTFVALAFGMLAMLALLLVPAPGRRRAERPGAAAGLAAAVRHQPVVIAVTGLFAWLLTSDLDQAMRQLEAEKRALQESHARIEVLAQRDSLTGLPNRALARDRLALPAAAGAAAGRHGGGDVPRPRQLQDHQRFAGPRRRRRAALPGGRQAAAPACASPTPWRGCPATSS